RHGRRADPLRRMGPAPPRARAAGAGRVQGRDAARRHFPASNAGRGDRHRITLGQPADTAVGADPPNTALEAMLQGAPVVAVRAGGVDELIADGSTGRLARAGDIDDLASQIMAV